MDQGSPCHRYLSHNNTKCDYANDETSRRIPCPGVINECLRSLVRFKKPKDSTMEIGDYGTNVVCTYELQSIAFSYFECSSKSASFSTALYIIVAELQQLGFLTAKDNTKPGLWIFENESENNTEKRSGGAVLSDLASRLGVDMGLKHKGAYDSNVLSDSWKTLSKPWTDNGETLSPKEFFEKNFRAAHAAAINKEATTNNAFIGRNNDTGNTGLALKDRAQQVQLHAQSRLSLQIHEYFLTAVLSSLGYALCCEKGYIPLSSRTLAVPKPNYATPAPHTNIKGNEESTDNHLQLVTLSNDYTSSKVLVIKACLSESTNYVGCDLPRHVKPEDVLIPIDTVLILGPGGITGNYKGLANQGFQPAASTYVGDADETQESGEQGQSSILRRWRSRCLEWLVSKGIQKEHLENSAWFMVELYSSQLISGARIANDSEKGSSPEDTILMPWPSLFCFRQINASLDEDIAFGTLSTFDPLEFAQTWYTGQHDRDITINRRKKDREASEAALKAQADVDTQDLHSLYSPVTLRRSSAAGLVYPTPPDGVQHAVGATPSFDETVSTPGQPSQQPSADVSGSLVAKIDSETSGPVDMPNNHNSDFDFQDTSNGNLFGDVGEDLFGEENDVTDADFSFFDEPNMFQGKQDADLPVQDNTVNEVETQLIPSPKDGLNMSDKMEIVDVRMGNTGETPGEDNQALELPFDGNSLPQAESNSDSNLMAVELTDPQIFPPEPSPPLKPESVFGRLSMYDIFSSPLLGKRDGDTSSAVMNATGAFVGVDFNPLFSSLHKKYETKGRFIYPPQRVSPSFSHHRLPTTNYFNQHRRRKFASRASSMQGLLRSADQLLLGSGQSINPESPVQNDICISSPPSDQDDSSDDIYDSPGYIPNDLKRKRQIEDVGNSNEEDEIASSFQDLQVAGIDETDNTALDNVHPFTLDTNLTGWSPTMLLTWPEPWVNEYTLTDPEYIAAAQILGDQAISCTLRYPNDGNDSNHGASVKGDIETTYVPNLIHYDVLQVAKKFFNSANTCTLSSFLDIQGIPRQLSSLNRLPPRPVPSSQGSQGSNSGKPSPLFQLPSPHLELRRSDSKLSVLASALPFWDVLGLAPRGNSKHITSICVFPNAAGMKENSDLFLENIRSAYETRRLGIHERLNVENCINGLLPIDIGGQTARFASDQGLSVIRESLFQVANALPSSTADCTNFVVYFIYDPDNPDILVPICSAFHGMFEVYKKAMTDKTALNELVLQLVPLNFIGARTHLVIPPPMDFARLAMEVYDRCFDFQSGAASPSVAIEPPLPRTIDFKLTAHPSASLLQENSCLHIAYAQSIDDRWISAAWSDNTGSEQMTASYCLGRQYDPLTRQFSDVAHEIWETTLDIIALKKVHWRIMIVKCGVMEPQDVRFWKGLAETERNAQISLTLLTVDTQPVLQLLPPDLSIPASTLPSQSAFYTTPVSTPQSSSILSPDQSGNNPATTPTDGVAELKIESDATLVDLTNQSYGAILAHRANNSNSPLEVRPTTISGFFIKRTGPSSSDIPVVMEVSIVWTDINPRHIENLLKEILSWYSGLATLARARGIVDPTKDSRPWHIAATEKTVRLLYLLM